MTTRSWKRSAVLMIALAAAISMFAGCAGTPKSGPGLYTQSRGDKAADTAITMIGRPYVYRGEKPSGFDCSGLVRYSYLNAGMDVPHGTKALLKVTRSISLGSAMRGDLVFFVQSGKKYSHVGIYIGNSRFIHAPSTGGRVRTDSLQNPYWKKHFLDVRRFR